MRQLNNMHLIVSFSMSAGDAVHASTGSTVRLPDAYVAGGLLNLKVALMRSLAASLMPHPYNDPRDFDLSCFNAVLDDASADSVVAGDHVVITPSDRFLALVSLQSCACEPTLTGFCKAALSGDLTLCTAYMSAGFDCNKHVSMLSPCTTYQRHQPQKQPQNHTATGYFATQTPFLCAVRSGVVDLVNLFIFCAADIQIGGGIYGMSRTVPQHTRTHTHHTPPQEARCTSPVRNRTQVP